LVTYQPSKKLHWGPYYGLAHSTDDPNGSKLVAVPSALDWLKDFAVASATISLSWWLAQSQFISSTH